MTARLVTTLILGMVLVASACGSDGVEESLLSDDSPEHIALVGVISNEMGGAVFTDTENTCVADRIVTQVGIEELATMGVTGEGMPTDIDLSAAEAQLLSESFDDGIQECTDLREVLNRAAGDDVDNICVLDQLPDEQLQTMFGLLSGRSDLTQEDIDALNTAADRAEQTCDPGVIDN